jgi:hypothetical protein
MLLLITSFRLAPFLLLAAAAAGAVQPSEAEAAVTHGGLVREPLLHMLLYLLAACQESNTDTAAPLLLTGGDCRW